MCCQCLELLENAKIKRTELTADRIPTDRRERKGSTFTADATTELSKDRISTNRRESAIETAIKLVTTKTAPTTHYDSEVIKDAVVVMALGRGGSTWSVISY